MDEPFVCYNCGNIAPLNMHLRCAYCNSDAVASAQTGTKALQARQANETLTDWAIKLVDTWLPPRSN